MDASTVNTIIGAAGAIVGSGITYVLLGKFQGLKLVQETYTGMTGDLRKEVQRLQDEMTMLRKIVDEKDIAYFKNQNLWMEENRNLRNKIEKLETEKTELQRKVQSLENK